MASSKLTHSKSARKSASADLFNNYSHHAFGPGCPEFAVLREAYPAITFVSITLDFQPGRLLESHPHLPASGIRASLRGGFDDLTAAGFALPSWSSVPSCGSRLHRKKGFGSAQVHKLKNGQYALRNLHLDRMLDRLRVAGGIATAIEDRRARLAECIKQARQKPAIAAAVFATAGEWKAKHHWCLGLSFLHIGNHRAPSSSPEMQEHYAAIYGARFRFAQEDLHRIDTIVARFREELTTAINKAAVVDREASRPSHLRLVVDNAAAVQS